MQHVPVGMPGFWAWFALGFWFLSLCGLAIHLVAKESGAKSSLPIAAFGIMIGMLITLNTSYDEWMFWGGIGGGIAMIVAWQKLEPAARAWRDRKFDPPTNPPSSTRHWEIDTIDLDPEMDITNLCQFQLSLA